MSRQLEPGDRVYDTWIEEQARVIRVYPELETAIVETRHGVEKAHFSDLVLMEPENAEPVEEKKKTLLGRIKAKISGRRDD